MSVWQTLRVAWRALSRHKGRMLLTTLGIMIGVAAVIAMVAVGEGARVKLSEAFNAMGTNLLILRSGSSKGSGAQGGYGSLPTITLDDLAAIRELSKVRRVSPRPEASLQLSSADANWRTDVGGVIPDFFDIRIWPIRRGRNISQSDVDAGTKVIVLGLTVARQLFGPDADPLDQQVRIGNVPFTVIGLLEHKGQSPGGYDLDDNSYVPFTTYMAKVQGGLRNYATGQTYVSASTPEDAGAAEAQITELLRERHHLQTGMEDDFQIRNMVEVAQAEADGAKTLGTLLAAVAAISLLIAGIGIMNIMLVSVTERTREIGLRMAVGARPRDVLVQFLVEAMALSLLGGLFGVALGIGGSDALSRWLDWPLLLRTDGIALALAVSAGVGVLFGVYPAWRAARLDVIDALRFES
jgi:putative ABC transport system permease protein